MYISDSTQLKDYFRQKRGKYLKLSNGKKVKLINTIEESYVLTLVFKYDNKTLSIPFDKLYSEAISVHIPNGLEKGNFISKIIKFRDVNFISAVLNKVLTSWTEQKELLPELDWEE